jgi:adenylate kinase family enzyme
MVHIHILGASGSGTTSLGSALAREIGALHLDADDYFWLPTDPPYTTPRAAPDRIGLLLQRALPSESWVLSGSALKWGTPIEPLYDLIVFLQIDPKLRMDRIKRREAVRYGARIEPGGDMAVKSREFLEWAASYDAAGPERRSLAAHMQWLATESCPIMQLDSSRSIDDLVSDVLGHAVLAAYAGKRSALTTLPVSPATGP